MSHASLLEEELVTEGMSSGTVDTFLQVLNSAIVQYDMQQQKKAALDPKRSYWNPYALGQLLTAADAVRDEVKDVLASDSEQALTRLKNAISRKFTKTRWRDGIIKKIDAFVAKGTTPSLKATSLTMGIPMDDEGMLVAETK